MANRNFPQSKVFGFHLLPVRVRASITIGAAGAVASSSGPGTKAIARMGAGVYRIQLQDSYASFLHMSASMIANGVTGSAIDPNAGVVGTLYQITLVGNTNWATAGIPSTVVPAVGQVFALAAAPASGTGRVKAAAVSNIRSIQCAGNPNSGMISLLTQSQGNGGYVTIVCLADTSSSVTTLVPTDPAQGDIILVDMLFNSSQVQ
jgi:hypothetical protein